MEQVILQANHISKRFGGVQALADCNFSCTKGEVHALIGENGAGKSTLVKVLCGVEHQDSGTIVYKGKEVNISCPADATALGIASVFQELSLVPDLTVAENIFLGCELMKNGHINFKEMRIRAQEILDSHNFKISSSSLVRQLSLTDQQQVEIAKALSKNPDVIIMDEATSALGQEQVENLFSIIRQLSKEEGKTVIFISHKMNELSEISDRATIYRDAHYITTFIWGEMNNSEIISAIAGREIHSDYLAKRKTLSDEVALEIEDMGYQGKLRDINISVRRGEIFGIAGLNGHGQLEFLKALYGAQKIDTGAIKVNGKVIKMRNPRVALQSGLALTPADRKTDGLLLSRSIGENIALMSLNTLSDFGIINRKKEHKGIDKIVNLLKIKMSSERQLCGTLSGGNQQKIVLGKAILTRANILLLADPTRGIDVGTKTEIYQLVRQLAEAGITIIFYSTENNELIGLCDRVAVFKAGSIVSVLEGENLTEREILKAALGVDDIGDNNE
ncbi:MAG: sugar ABC transporter ATP-binding protein [Flexilinea sp.]